MPGRFRWLPLLIALAGCDPSPLPEEPAPADEGRPVAGARFDPRRAGSLRGQVVWDQPPPTVPPFRSLAQPLAEWPPPGLKDWPNPNAPLPAASPRAVREAVVFLRGIVPEEGKPWHGPPPRVEVSDDRLVIAQGAHARRTGFLRCGDALAFASRSEQLQLIQARGAAFFALPLPDVRATGSRRLDRPGLIELRSAMGFFWQRAYLFVDDHPYWAHTDAQGRFVLEDVPAGNYEVVAWHPDWRVARRERHFDVQRVIQVYFDPPRQAVRKVSVAPGRACEVRLMLSSGR